jgi:hypothetical protein
MARPEKMVSAGDEWIPYQEMLLAMVASTVDDVVAKFNSDSVWSDPRTIAQVVASAAGSRKNGPELIEFMQKISDSRGYSSMMLKVNQIGKLNGNLRVACGFSDVMARVCKRLTDDPKRIRDLAVAAVGDFIQSDEFPVRVAVSELIALMDAVAQRPKEEEGVIEGSHLGARRLRILCRGRATVTFRFGMR